MEIRFKEVCSRDGILDLDLSIDLSRTCVLFDPHDNLARAILYLLVGLDTLSCGEILIDDIPINEYIGKEPLIRSFGYVFNEGIMLSNLSLKENLMLPLRWLNPNLNEREIDGLIISWLNTFQLQLDLNHRPVKYRPGSLKLLSYIRALLITPRALIIDDPYFLLNKKERIILYDNLCHLRNSYPMLIASTDDDFVSGFAGQVIDLSGFENNYRSS